MSESGSLPPIERPPSLKDIAFKSIKQSIMNGSLKCGAIYSENVVSKTMGISKTPVHEALLELSYKGFIEILPKKGFKLKDLTEKDIQDIYYFRLALEKVVFSNAVEKADATEVKYLKSILSELEASTDTMQFIETDIRFHRYMAMLTDNQQIIDALDRIWDLCVWIGFRTLSARDDLAGVLKEHLTLLDCIEKKDAINARKRMEEHIESSLDKILGKTRDADSKQVWDGLDTN